MSHRIMIVFSVITLLVSGTLAIAQETQHQETPEVIAQTIVNAINLIDQKQIRPETRQAMLQRAIVPLRANFNIANDGGWDARLIGLSSVVSKVSTDEEFQRLLVRELTSEDNLNQVNRYTTARLLAALGVTPTENKEARIQASLQANRYVGIGIRIALDHGGLPVMQQVIPGGQRR